MSVATRVTVIPPKMNLNLVPLSTEYVKKRVAAYARVSTDTEEQLTSYEAQVDYYTRYIQANAEWEFIEVYTDEGISATTTKKREGFKRMVQDALNGKIDLIVTKSVSRFARNTVDTLTTVRQLKEKGVEVYFEKENIYTLDSKGELLITIMSSLAQEESRSLSENVTWGQRKRMQDGTVTLPYKQFLGYEKGEDGLPKIVPKEAKIVRMIYTLYFRGMTQNAIAKHLTEQGFPTPARKTKWNVSTVLSILQNEKYKGDAILQKTFWVDFLTKTMKVNEGEVPQYYVENSHPAIIEPELFDLVQAEIKRRKAAGIRQSSANIFSSKIVCGECDSFYGSKVWHSNSKYRRTVWQCNGKYGQGVHCTTPHLSEDDIRQAFVNAFNQIFEEKERLLEDYAMIVAELTDQPQFDKEIAKLEEECDVVRELLRRHIEENARSIQNQDDYQQRYDTLAERYEATHRQRFIEDLRKQKALLTDFDEELWIRMVESVTVFSGKHCHFNLKDGSEVQLHGITKNAHKDCFDANSCGLFFMIIFRSTFCIFSRFHRGKHHFFQPVFAC